MKLFKDGIRLCWSLLPRKQLLSTTATSHESPSTAEPPQCGDSSAPTPNHALKSDPRLPCAVETQTPNEVPGSSTEGTRRANSLSLPTIRLPAELQKAVDKVLTSTSVSNRHAERRLKPCPIPTFTPFFFRPCEIRKAGSFLLLRIN